jgi:hypothetical protein
MEILAKFRSIDVDRKHYFGNRISKAGMIEIDFDEVKALN